ncbi:RagB/SusD family nutrient uptake outer membrane protein [Hymenobacter sp. BT188]|uniref:RagB/SusD family nutrient uptake outer membrane protein n=1 Tax=Hymenobacter sp. BT188 TaxID=2763504 RepID=UPI0016517AAA|nr:RagB/SusD family nutrient uptake outer membrane protein [Hymenobacter sp. BT188]MBC6606642.1 RagB/SusD family nutrient uptake outer membrane protein [Hymenobacter sp. BT188]
MKTIFFRSAAITALSLSLGLGACDDKLDIEPLQAIDATTALSSEDNVTSAVTGLYSSIGGSNLYGTNLILVPELMAADGYINFQGTFANYRQLARRTTNSENASAQGIWQAAYQTINQANLVIDALPVVTTAGLKARYEGEARFIRAAMYFELVRLYAKQYTPGTTNTQLGVAINLVPVKSPMEASVLGARATVEEVYTQVITDLTQASTLLPVNNGSRASRFTARALLARVYLQQSNFTAARTQANDVITNSGKSLSPTLQSVFTGRNTSETLLEIQQNDQNNAGAANTGLATLFSSIGQQGRGDVQVLTAFANQYEANDARGRSQLIYVGTGANSFSGQLRSGKYTTFGQNIPVIRLAEMYLIRAEAAFRAGDIPSALVDINRVRTRSGATTLTAPQLTLATILRERQLELAFEGFRIHDLKRTGTNIVTTGTPPVIIPITSNILVLPIPKRETDLNSNLVQNPGY